MQNKPDVVGTAKLAKVLGITDRRIQQLVTEGVFRKIGRGKYDLAGTVQAYIQYQIDILKAKQSTGTKAEEETILIRYKAAREKLEYEIARAEHLPLSLCVQTWQTWLRSISAQMLGLAPQLKTEFPHLDHQVITRMDALIRERLSELSQDGIPPELRKRVEIFSGNAEAADSDDGKRVG